MTVAALYDVHENVRALEAVPADGAADADVVLFGGDHLRWLREQIGDAPAQWPPTLVLDGSRIVNPGGVGNPTVRATAWWALVGEEIELRTTDYDTVRILELLG